MKDLLQRVRFSVIIKVLFVGFLVAVLGVPLMMIDSIVDERQARRGEAEKEISARWGGAQTVGGPILAVPYTVNGGRHIAYVLPDSLAVTGTVRPEKRYRSIYEVIIYTGEITLAGSIPLPALPAGEGQEVKILWPEAELLVSLSDIRGIRDNVRLQWAGGERRFEPALQNRWGKALGGSVADAGRGEWNTRTRFIPPSRNEQPVALLRAELGLADGPVAPLTFNITLNLNGSGQLQFLPLGRETRVAVNSSWPDPSFCGAFLPANRTIRDNGFDADWQVYYLSRNIPQQWAEEELNDIGAGRSLPSCAEAWMPWPMLICISA